MKQHIFILATLFILAIFQTLPGNAVEDEPPLSGELKQGVREVRVEAFRYGYKPSLLVVKQGERVRLRVSSSDVTHGILISEFKVNEVVRKGETKAIEFMAGKKGTFEIHCSVYCGPGHPKMKGQLVVR